MELNENLTDLKKYFVFKPLSLRICSSEDYFLDCSACCYLRRSFFCSCSAERLAKFIAKFRLPLFSHLLSCQKIHFKIQEKLFFIMTPFKNYKELKRLIADSTGRFHPDFSHLKCLIQAHSFISRER